MWRAGVCFCLFFCSWHFICVVFVLRPGFSVSGGLVPGGRQPSKKYTFTLFSTYGHRGALPDKDFGTGACGPVSRRAAHRGRRGRSAPEVVERAGNKGGRA